MPYGSRWSPWRSLLVLSPILLGAPWLAYDQHYSTSCPSYKTHSLYSNSCNRTTGFPYCAVKISYDTTHQSLIQTYRTNPITKLPQISEERILGIAKHLSEGIGYRIVGSYEHALADDWMVEAAQMVQRNCERIVLLTKKKLECEVWRQQGSGNHRCDYLHNFSSARSYKIDLT